MVPLISINSHRSVGHRSLFIAMTDSKSDESRTDVPATKRPGLFSLLVRGALPLGFLAAGYIGNWRDPTGDTGGSLGTWLGHLDESGLPHWERRYWNTETESCIQHGESSPAGFHQTPDGGYLIAGSMGMVCSQMCLLWTACEDLFLMKVGPTGTIESRSLGSRRRLSPGKACCTGSPQ